MRRGKREKMRSYCGYKYKSREELAWIRHRYRPRARTYTQPSRRYMPFALWMNDYVCRMNKSRVPGRDRRTTAFTDTYLLRANRKKKKKKRYTPVISSQRTHRKMVVDDPTWKKKERFRNSFGGGTCYEEFTRLYPLHSLSLTMCRKLRAVAGCRKTWWLLIFCIDHACPGLSDSITRTFPLVRTIYIYSDFIYIYLPHTYLVITIPAASTAESLGELCAGNGCEKQKKVLVSSCTNSMRTRVLSLTSRTKFLIIPSARRQRNRNFWKE